MTFQDLLRWRLGWKWMNAAKFGELASAEMGPHLGAETRNRREALLVDKYADELELWRQSEGLPDIIRDRNLDGAFAVRKERGICAQAQLGYSCLRKTAELWRCAVPTKIVPRLF